MDADIPPNQEPDFDSLCREAHEAYLAHGRNKSRAARHLGIDRGTFRNRLEKFHMRDLDGTLPGGLQPGFEVKKHTKQFNADGELTGQSIQSSRGSSDEPYTVPTGHRVKGETAFVDADGRVLHKHIKTVEDGRSLEDLAEAMKVAAATHVSPSSPVLVAPAVAKRADEDLLNLHPLPDLHLGMAAHFKLAQMDWNLKVAVETFRRLMELLVERSAWAATGVVLGGGDLLHFDDPTRMTRKSGNVMDSSDPYPIVLAEAKKLMVYQVELALAKYQRVVVRVLPGNHDPDSAIAVTHYLAAWFRNEPRVEVDTDPGLFWFHKFGRVMLAATHGHEARIYEMPGIMAADRPKMWGETDHRHAHGFHIHHATKSNGNEGGAKWQTHETPVPRDEYHQNRKYRSQRSLGTITYHKRRGESGSASEVVL